MATFSRAPAAALVAAVLFTPAACGQDDDPLAGRDDQPAPTSRPTSSSSPPPQSSDIPAAATERTDAGAEAFVKYYFETVVNETYESGDLDDLVRYSHPQCIICRATIGDVASGFTRGEVESGSVSVRAVEATEVDEDLTNVEVSYGVSRYVEVDEDGDTVFSSPAKTGIDLVVQLQYSESLESWRVREIVNQDRLEPSTASPEPG